MKVRRPDPDVLELHHSRVGAAVILGFLLLFLGAWYSVLVGAIRHGNGDLPILPLLLLWVCPLLTLPEIIRQASRLARGEVFIFDRARGVISRNGVERALFSEVARVQIRTIQDTDGNNSYRLSVVLESEHKLRIDHSLKEEKILCVAEDLADLLDVNIARRGD